VVDSSFKAFASENDFISDVETLLNALRRRIEVGKVGVLKEDIQFNDPEAQYKEVVSFIAIDIDNQTSLTNKYGDKMTRNLSRVVGLRILRQLNVLFTNPENCKLYHAYADRFYLLLKGVTLEQARAKAWLFRNVLNGSYQVDALRSSSEQPPAPENMIATPDITVRLGVAAYQYKKLEELLQRYPAATAEASTTALICRDLDAVLRAGQDEGGNVIMSWEPKIWGYIPWSPSDETERYREGDL
jgi:GGDEF domain-containing protein